MGFHGIRNKETGNIVNLGVLKDDCTEEEWKSIIESVQENSETPIEVNIDEDGNIVDPLVIDGDLEEVIENNEDEIN